MPPYRLPSWCRLGRSYQFLCPSLCFTGLYEDSGGYLQRAWRVHPILNKQAWDVEVLLGGHVSNRRQARYRVRHCVFSAFTMLDDEGKFEQTQTPTSKVFARICKIQHTFECKVIGVCSEVRVIEVRAKQFDVSYNEHAFLFCGAIYFGGVSGATPKPSRVTKSILALVK